MSENNVNWHLYPKTWTVIKVPQPYEAENERSNY